MKVKLTETENGFTFELPDSSKEEKINFVDAQFHAIKIATANNPGIEIEEHRITKPLIDFTKN